MTNPLIVSVCEALVRRGVQAYVHNDVILIDVEPVQDVSGVMHHGVSEVSVDDEYMWEHQFFEDRARYLASDPEAANDAEFNGWCPDVLELPCRDVDRVVAWLAEEEII